MHYGTMVLWLSKLHISEEALWDPECFQPMVITGLNIKLVISVLSTHSDRDHSAMGQ